MSEGRGAAREEACIDWIIVNDWDRRAAWVPFDVMLRKGARAVAVWVLFSSASVHLPVCYHLNALHKASVQHCESSSCPA